MMLTRRCFTSSAAVAALAGCATNPSISLQQQMLRDAVNRYVGFGWHRTGGRGDADTSRWIADRLERSGYLVQNDAFEVETLIRAEARLAIGGVDLPCALQWAPADGVRRLQAPLAIAGAGPLPSGAIAVLPALAPMGAYWTRQADEILAGLARAGAQAVIIGVDSPADAPFLYNRSASPPLAAPVIVTAPSLLGTLREAAQQGASVDFAMASERATVRTQNIVADAGEGLDRIVLSTPMTGWFGCGGERGAGVALLLLLAERLHRIGARVTVLCSSGHELGHVGMDRLLDRFAPPPDRIKLWVHLGASIASPNVAPTASVFATPRNRPQAQAAFTPLSLEVAEANPKTPGETGSIVAAGYPQVLGFAGSNPQFHTELDDGRSINFDLLEGIFRATLETINALRQD